MIPSHACARSDAHVNFAYKSYFGQLSSIRSYWADVNNNFSKSHKRGYKHVGGLGLYNDKEGEFFNRNRVIGRYAWHLPLTERWYLSGGTALHVINYAFTASSAGSGGSDLDWSGNIGASVYTDDTKFGLSINDFNSPKLQPVDYKFMLYRFFTAHAEKNFRLNEQLTLMGSLRCNLIPGGKSSLVSHIGMIIGDRLGIYGFVHTFQGWGWAFDLGRIKIKEGWFDLSFAYKAPYNSQGRPPYSNYEINLGYYFKRKVPEENESLE